MPAPRSSRPTSQGVNSAWPPARPISRTSASPSPDLHVGNGHAGPFGGKQFGHGGADAAGAAADPSDLASSEGCHESREVADARVRIAAI